jgi:peptidyl-prolyl cis-trans isomerase C
MQHFSGKSDAKRACKALPAEIRREIGGGRIVVNWPPAAGSRQAVTRTLAPRWQSAIAKPRFSGEKGATPRFQAIGHPLFKDSAMTIPFFAGPIAPLRRAGLLAAILSLLLLAGGPLRAQDNQTKDPIVATVNGIEIHESDLATAEAEAGQIPPMSPAAKKDYLVQFMTDLILVAKAAEDKNMAATDAFKRKLAFERRKLLMTDLLQSVGKDALTDEAMHKVYDDAVKQMSGEQEVHARHILIRAAPGDEKASNAAKKKVEAIIVRLKNGEDFAAVAKEVTEDPSGKTNGGDLGYFGKEQMVPEFAEIAFKLDKGGISDPVKTQFGWHVIKVEDKRNKTPPSFDDVKPQIEQFVVRKAQAELVQKLRTEAKIEKFYKSDADEKKDAAPEKTDEPAKK